MSFETAQGLAVLTVVGSLSFLFVCIGIALVIRVCREHQLNRIRRHR